VPPPFSRFSPTSLPQFVRPQGAFLPFCNPILSFPPWETPDKVLLLFEVLTLIRFQDYIQVRNMRNKESKNACDIRT
jgi:hypothetical protein